MDGLVHKLRPWEPSAARGEQRTRLKIMINFYNTTPEQETGRREGKMIARLYTGSPKSNVVQDLFVPARPRPWLEIDTMLCYIVHQNIAYFVVINVSICNLC